MPPTVGQALGVMKEHVRPNLPKMYVDESKVWHKIGGPKANVEIVSNRPTRAPAEFLQGFKSRTGNPDAGPLGRGSGPTTDAFTLIPVYIYQAGEITKAQEINTKSDSQAIKSYAQLLSERALDAFNNTMESLLNTAGDFTLDTVVSTGTGVLNVNNANQFRDNIDVDLWTALGGTFLGTVTILSVDGANNQLNLTGAVPAGVVAGTLILFNGAAAVSNSGLFGIEYFHVQSNVGSVMNIQRSAYPGKLSTPHVSVGGNALTPAIARRLEAQMIAAMGVEAPDKENLIAHMNTDMAAAWENNTLAVSSVIVNQVSGSNTTDIMKKSPPKTFAGRPIERSIHAKPGRIDLLALALLYKIENQPIDYYDVAGQTEFPVYANDGAPIQSTVSYLWTGVQLGHENVRLGAYADNITIPTGYFGK